MRFTLRSHRTFADDAKGRVLGAFTMGCILAVNTGFWLWLLVLPPLAVAHARAATRGPMHTRGTELVNTTVAAAIMPLFVAAIVDRWSPPFLLAIGVAAWAGIYVVFRFQTRRTCREMARTQGTASAGRPISPPSRRAGAQRQHQN